MHKFSHFFLEEFKQNLDTGFKHAFKFFSKLAKQPMAATVIFEFFLLLVLNSVCPKTSCLDGKIQFRGVLKKMVVRFIELNEQ